MQRNNPNQAFVILSAALKELGKLSFDSSVCWAEDTKQAIEHLHFAVEEIDNEADINDSFALTRQLD